MPIDVTETDLPKIANDHGPLLVAIDDWLRQPMSEARKK